jgi:hypothetical protein
MKITKDDIKILKEKHGYKAATMCDFGQSGKEHIVRGHKTVANAHRAYRRIWNIYHHLWGFKVWIIEFDDSKRINK